MLLTLEESEKYNSQGVCVLLSFQPFRRLLQNVRIPSPPSVPGRCPEHRGGEPEVIQKAGIPPAWT